MYVSHSKKNSMRRYTNVIFTKNNAWIILYILGMNDKIKTIKLLLFKEIIPYLFVCWRPLLITTSYYSVAFPHL